MANLNNDPPPYNPTGLELMNWNSLPQEYKNWVVRQEAKQEKAVMEYWSTLRELATLGAQIQAKASLQPKQKEQMMNYVERAKRILENQAEVDRLQAEIEKGYKLESAIQRMNNTYKKKNFNKAIQNYAGSNYIQGTLTSNRYTRIKKSFNTARTKKEKARNNLKYKIQNNGRTPNFRSINFSSMLKNIKSALESN